MDPISLKCLIWKQHFFCVGRVALLLFTLRCACLLEFKDIMIRFDQFHETSKSLNEHALIIAALLQ